MPPDDTLETDANAGAARPGLWSDTLMLRKTFVLLALLMAGASACAQTMPEPRTVRISDRVYVLLGPIQHANQDNQGYMINATVFVGDKGVILVDTGGTRQVGVHIAKAIRRITAKPVTHVINTHSHGDHYLGNSAFAGATIISSEKCRTMVIETGYQWLALMEQLVGRKFSDTKPIAAGVTYREGSRTEIVLHGIRLVFWVPKGSHTVGDMLVYMPQDKVLVTGDIVVNGIVPVMQDAIGVLAKAKFAGLLISLNGKNWKGHTSSAEISTGLTWKSKTMVSTSNLRHVF